MHENLCVVRVRARPSAATASISNADVWAVGDKARADLLPRARISVENASRIANRVPLLIMANEFCKSGLDTVVPKILAPLTRRPSPQEIFDQGNCEILGFVPNLRRECLSNALLQACN